MKVALVHDWLVGFGGAETVLEEMVKIYPQADIYTLFSDPEYIQKTIFKDSKIFNTSLQKIPMIKKIYRKLPNLFPMAIEEFDFTGYDLVISSSHAVAKGILTDAKTCHISYVHTPMRYIWDLTFDYLRRANFPKPIEWYTKRVFHRLRMWDVVSSVRPDFYIANSNFIKRRIQKIYRRDSEVIYPPVTLSDKIYTDKQDYYVAASRHVPYKNIPLIAEAFSKMPDKKLVILGEGSDSQKVQQICHHSPNIEHRGFLPREELMKTIGEAKAFVFAAEEDFGIILVEAQSLGTPVIAYGVGGSRETVVDSKTGVFFEEQSVDSICQAVQRFESMSFDPNIVAQHSQQFSQEQFRQKLQKFVTDSYQEFQQNK